MRSRSAFLALCLFIAATGVACRKHKPTTGIPVIVPAGTNITKELGNVSLAEAQQTLEGKWYLLGSSGGIAGQSTKSSGVYHVFGKTEFTINDNNKVKNFPCTWDKVKSIHTGGDVPRLEYSGVGITFLRIINDTLYTSDNNYDGYGSEYIKIK